jgi:hypothetical protein
VLRRASIVVALLALVAPPAVAAPSDPDPSFGQGGVALIGDAYQTVRGAAVTPDGGIVVVGDGFRAHRALRHGGMTVHLTLRAGNRLTLTLRRARSPHTVLARGTARARQGPDPLHLRTTRRGTRVFHNAGPMRLRAQARLLAAHAPALAASTTITLPATHG